jgi:RNA recognition motif-containing protein
MRIYVGNLNYDTTDKELREAFEAFGTVTSAEVVINRMTNRSRGFGFVEMPDPEEARNAIAQMDGKELQGRQLKVNEAHPRT